MQILEDLYIGNVRPGERMFKRNSQYAKALDETVKAGDALTASLSDEQKEFFEDYMTAQREVNILTDCETFCYGFKVGAKIMLDVLTEGQMKEILSRANRRWVIEPTGFLAIFQYTNLEKKSGIL